jgi:two-component system, chemotaxis family, chemotaxis protein CheY
MKPSSVTVALVGHCGADASSLKRFVSKVDKGASVVRVNDEASLRDSIDSAAVMLVNRALDGSLGTSSGVELIRTLASNRGNSPLPALLLVSNYADAQEEAEAAGAMPGFGKSDLRGSEAASRLEAALRAARS